MEAMDQENVEFGGSSFFEYLRADDGADPEVLSRIEQATTALRKLKLI